VLVSLTRVVHGDLRGGQGGGLALRQGLRIGAGACVTRGGSVAMARGFSVMGGRLRGATPIRVWARPTSPYSVGPFARSWCLRFRGPGCVRGGTPRLRTPDNSPPLRWMARVTRCGTVCGAAGRGPPWPRAVGSRRAPESRRRRGGAPRSGLGPCRGARAASVLRSAPPRRLRVPAGGAVSSAPQPSSLEVGEEGAGESV
jgi:hypothetical protein